MNDRITRKIDAGQYLRPTAPATTAQLARWAFGAAWTVLAPMTRGARTYGLPTQAVQADDHQVADAGVLTG
ncbi:hypothetical protein ACRAWF_15515 [Streptomyces sp. L7]